MSENLNIVSVEDGQSISIDILATIFSEDSALDFINEFAPGGFERVILSIAASSVDHLVNHHLEWESAIQATYPKEDNELRTTVLDRYSLRVFNGELKVFDGKPIPNRNRMQVSEVHVQVELDRLTGRVYAINFRGILNCSEQLPSPSLSIRFIDNTKLPEEDIPVMLPQGEVRSIGEVGTTIAQLNHFGEIYSSEELTATSFYFGNYRVWAVNGGFYNNVEA